MFNPNYICLFGLTPFIFSSMYNINNIHSLFILFFGILFHTNKTNNYFRNLDIIQCFLNGGIVFYLSPDSRIYGISTLGLYLFNTKYLNSNDYIHTLVQLSSWYGICIYENKLTN